MQAADEAPKAAIRPKKVNKKRTSSNRTDGKGTDMSKAQGAFRVAVRCRPLLAHERGKESVLTLTKDAVMVTGSDDAERPESPRMVSPRRERSDFGGQRTAKSFSFDHVYDEFCTQEEVYSQFVAPYTALFLTGYNVTLFAYGQTGTGKTYTVIGGEPPEERGVVPRFVEAVFAHVAAEAEAREREAAEGGGPPHLAVFDEDQSADAQPLLAQTQIEKVGITILEVCCRCLECTQKRLPI